MKDRTMHFTLGALRVDGIDDLPVMDFPMATLLPQAMPADLDPMLPWLAPDHYTQATSTAHLAGHSILLRFGGRVVLVDTCVGCGKARPIRPAWHLREGRAYLDRLAATGVHPDQVDTVFCTHLHVDHIGWNTRLQDGRWVPTFPNARYLFGRTELGHWQSQVALRGEAAVNHGSYTDSVVPILEAGQADLVDDGHDLAPGMVLRGLPGHTPGQMGLFLDGLDGRALFCGDAVHSPAQIARPDWSTAFCADAARASQTRVALVEEAAERGTLLVPAHFRGSGAVRVLRDAGSFRPAFIQAIDARG
jgi:glyoxylase-like metal-dependent hydrolase (beta-lactamase superfamily II)